MFGTFLATLEATDTKLGRARSYRIEAGEDLFGVWLVDVTYQNGEFSGRINNEPGMVSNVQMGDRRQVAKAEISDWLFMRDGKMHGNYTLRPLLKTMPEKDVKIYEAMLADP